MSVRYVIDRARVEDIPLLPDIERDAIVLFERTPIPEAARAEPTSVEGFRHAFDAGLLWVARAASGAPVGFVVVKLLGPTPHLDEIDVHPSFGRQGIGLALVETVLNWARAGGYESITLTSFRDVPWNAPFYQRLGFRVLDASELTPALRAVVQDEAERGFDPARRVVMRRTLLPISRD